MNVIAYDPYVPDGYEKSIGVERVNNINDAISEADIVSFHTPLNNETKGMADSSFFDVMKDDAVLVNTARGEIVDLGALYDALKDGTIRAAGLDVLGQEPSDPDHPLIEAWRQQPSWIRGRIKITPHAAFYCDEALKQTRKKAAQTVYEYLEMEN